MSVDRPSREYRLVHEADTGLPMLEPVPDTDPLPGPPTTPTRLSHTPKWVTSWAPVIVALVGAGGIGPLLQGLMGDGGQKQAVEDLSKQVQELRVETRERWAELHAQVATLERRKEAEDAAQRARMDIVDGYLRQRDPDIKKAREVLASAPQ